MTPAEIHEALKATFAEDVICLKADLYDPVVEISPSSIREICLFARDDKAFGFDFLRCLTGVDRPDCIEVVYHLFSYTLRHAVVLKVRLDRQQPVVDSVHDIWPVANWYEREAYDLLGVTFTGHPNLRRLLLPDDWVGHPLRKDYVRPAEYHGIHTSREGAVPVSRWSTGNRPGVVHAMHEAKTRESLGFARLNMGPIHPATHGVLNFMLETDGEILRRAIPDVGYLHRGIEKITEGIPYLGTMPYTDRVDYLGAMFTNHAWALAVERLAGIAVPARGEYCRVIASELNRIASHLIATGSMALDLGAVTPFVHWLREREKVNDIMERICGARLTYNYFRFGGVARDIDDETLAMIIAWLDHFEPIIDEFDRLISNNEIFVRRLANIATISASQAIAWGLVGPNLRASGVDWDLRRDLPYSVYRDLEFRVIVGQGWRGTIGDSYDRFVCRVLEMRQSAHLLRQAIKAIPKGDFWTKSKAVKPAPNEVYACVESARGEIAAYVVSNGTDKPHRGRFRTGSFTAMPIIEEVSPGLMVADLVALIGSLDVIAPEVDR
jgi:NADH-quinone oxidoreductase subunit D